MGRVTLIITEFTIEEFDPRPLKVSLLLSISLMFTRDIPIAPGAKVKMIFPWMVAFGVVSKSDGFDTLSMIKVNPSVCSPPKELEDISDAKETFANTTDVSEDSIFMTS